MTGQISLLPFTFEAADPTLGPIGAWLAPALGRTLPPVIWRGALDDGPGLDELAPASTARPWLVAEHASAAAAAAPPRARSAPALVAVGASRRRRGGG